MRAILLAAGLGTRLRPLTYKTPKCLVPIKGEPLLGIWLKHLKKTNNGPFLINTHYLANQVKDFIENSEFKDDVSLVFENELQGTAGTLINNISFFEKQDGLLIHADNYCLPDIVEFEKAHKIRPTECLMSMMTFRTDNPTECGIVEVNKRGVIVGFHEKTKNPPGNLANGAIYILSAKLLEILETKKNKVNDFSTEVLNKLVGKIYNYEISDSLIDIGTVKAYTKANTE
jgi:mannose-1-phosphate guanylyltransferase